MDRQQTFAALGGQHFDVAIIGGGINGASAAQQLSAAGYSCLVVDKNDFGSGATGRSARMLHPGLRYFEVPNPLVHFALHPRRFIDSLKGARQAMHSAAEHLADSGERISTYRMCFPVFKGDPFRAWHVRAGLTTLQLLGNGRVDLDVELVRPRDVHKVPFSSSFNGDRQIDCIACYNEFKFEWPERFCIDMLLDAERNGATLVNYCSAQLGEQRANDRWSVTLTNTLERSVENVSVTADKVVNVAGYDIDALLPATVSQRKLVCGTKGVHIVVELPEEFSGFGMASMNSLGLPYYVLPLHKQFFSIGVTETPFHGDASEVTATESDIDFLLNETRRLLPGLKLRRDDVIRTWAGVRPLTNTSADAMGSRTRVLHDLEARGLPGVFALTSGPIMTHRQTGRLLKDAVAAGLRPSGNSRPADYSPYAFTLGNNSPAFVTDEPDVREADIELAATSEYAQSLDDVLLRRTGLAWRRRLTESEIEKAAAIVGPCLGWSPEQHRQQVQSFVEKQRRDFGSHDTLSESEQGSLQLQQ